MIGRASNGYVIRWQAAVDRFKVTKWMHFEPDYSLWNSSNMLPLLWSILTDKSRRQSAGQSLLDNALADSICETSVTTIMNYVKLRQAWEGGLLTSGIVPGSNLLHLVLNLCE